MQSFEKLSLQIKEGVWNEGLLIISLLFFPDCERLAYSAQQN